MRTRSFLQLVAHRVALALYAALYERERIAGQSLQRSLLPGRPPLTPGLDVAVRYFPASGDEVGGDWYDVFILPNGSIGLAIGDVVGRGLPASSTMAKIRNALRAYALDARSRRGSAAPRAVHVALEPGGDGNRALRRARSGPIRLRVRERRSYASVRRRADRHVLASLEVAPNAPSGNHHRYGLRRAPPAPG